MTFTFAPATRQQRKARIGLVGPSGSGKTYTALTLAKGLAGGGGRIAVIDTENNSASLYADEFDFSVLNLETFSPEVYVQAIRAAEQAGFDVIIIDSLSHAWMGKDGALEQVDRAAKRYQGNSYAAWRDVTPKHNELVEAMVRCKNHLIVTMRAKTEYVVEKDEKTGKTMPRKVGLAPIQRDGLEYEFDIVADMDLENNFIVSKTRYKPLTGAVIHKPGPEIGEQVKAWLEDGAPMPDPPRVVPQPVASATAPDANGNANGHTNVHGSLTVKGVYKHGRSLGLSDDTLKAILNSATNRTDTKGMTLQELQAWRAAIDDLVSGGDDIQEDPIPGAVVRETLRRARTEGETDA